MGLRFGRSFRLMPGVRLNIGGRGCSLTLGVPGASVNVGPRGTFGTVGLPGTGLSYRERLSGGERRGVPHETTECSIALVGDVVRVTTVDGAPVDDRTSRKVLRENAAAVTAMLDREIERREAEREDAIRPRSRSEPPRLHDARPERRPDEDVADWRGRIAAWRAERGDDEHLLVEALESIHWGRQVDVECGIRDGRVLLDVDLPGLDDLPGHRWKAAGSGIERGVVETPLPVAERHRRYARHVAAVVRVTLDAVFTGVPRAATVVVNAHATREGRRDHLCVVAAERRTWDAERGEKDDEIALVRMGAAMSTTSTGRLRPQTPTTD